VSNMNHLDLFSGIGGFALAASWVWGKEHNVVSFCEIEPFAQKVLKKYWPEVPIIEDVRNVKGSNFSDVTLCTGGFPCQPFSVAGKQQGKGDHRFIWDEMCRVVSEVKPEWVIGENVPGLVSNDNGVVFEQICIDLEVEGYEVQPFIIPACAADAPHRRDRIWIVANRKCQQSHLRDTRPCRKGEAMAYTASEQAGRLQQLEFSPNVGPRSNWTEKAQKWATEPDVGRVAHGIPDRVDRLKGLGNAIVPQVVVPIMEAIRTLTLNPKIHQTAKGERLVI